MRSLAVLLVAVVCLTIAGMWYGPSMLPPDAVYQASQLMDVSPRQYRWMHSAAERGSMDARFELTWALKSRWRTQRWGVAVDTSAAEAWYAQAKADCLDGASLCQPHHLAGLSLMAAMQRDTRTALVLADSARARGYKKWLHSHMTAYYMALCRSDVVFSDSLFAESQASLTKHHAFNHLSERQHAEQQAQFYQCKYNRDGEQPLDHATATHWLRTAADLGSESAQQTLSNMQAQGVIE